MTVTQESWARKLAANDKKVRDKALKTLSRFLAKQVDMSELECLKIWKGLFYSMWFSDKVPVQQELAEKLSKIVHVFPLVAETTFTFSHVFWRTMAREWIGIDQYRLNKYYSLFRKCVRESFNLMHRHKWDTEPVKRLTDIYQRTPLSVDERASPNGIRLHVIDVYLSELENVLQEKGVELSYTQAAQVLAPLFALLAQTEDRVIWERVTTTVLDVFAERVSSDGDEDEGDDGEDDGTNTRPPLLSFRVLALIFQTMAASPKSNNKFRARMFKQAKRFSELAKRDPRKYDDSKASDSKLKKVLFTQLDILTPAKPLPSDTQVTGKKRKAQEMEEEEGDEEDRGASSSSSSSEEDATPPPKKKSKTKGKKAKEVELVAVTPGPSAKKKSKKGENKRKRPSVEEEEQGSDDDVDLEPAGGSSDSDSTSIDMNNLVPVQPQDSSKKAKKSALKSAEPTPKTTSKKKKRNSIVFRLRANDYFPSDERIPNTPPVLRPASQEESILKDHVVEPKEYVTPKSKLNMNTMANSASKYNNVAADQVPLPGASASASESSAGTPPSSRKKQMKLMAKKKRAAAKEHDSAQKKASGKKGQKGSAKKKNKRALSPR